MSIVYRNVRFSAKVDQCLRRRFRTRGDLSIRVREALNQVNLHEVDLFDVDYRRVHATQVGVDDATWMAANEAAYSRGCSLNTLVNSAVWAVFGARNSSKSRTKNKQKASVVEPCLSAPGQQQRIAPWESGLANCVRTSRDEMNCTTRIQLAGNLIRDLVMEPSACDLSTEDHEAVGVSTVEHKVQLSEFLQWRNKSGAVAVNIYQQ